MMRKIIFLVLLALVVSCNCKTNELRIAEEKEAISSVIDSWHLAAAEADFEAYFSKMSPNSIFIGTDASENWDIAQFQSFSKPYFDKGKAWSFKSVEKNIYIHSNGEIAWFDELLDTWMGVCRGSGVLQKTENSWKIEHYVLSLTVPNDNIKEVVKVNKKHDSIYLSKFIK